MMVIILNCITLGMYRPCSDIECDSQRCLILQGFDHFIFAFFAAEMVVKVMAMGFIGKQGYLGETWNRLDFFIVVAGVLEYSLNLENVSLSAIRTIRVLRPLRAINRIPSLRILVMLLLDTLPMLGNVLMLCFFVFFIFGIIGVQLWKGLLRNRCFLDLNATVGDGYPNLTDFYVEDEPWTDYVCSLPSDKGMRHCTEIKPLYSFDGLICNGSALPDADNSYIVNSSECVNWNQYYTKCAISDENPFLNSISFDNILYAWIAIFQVITLEGWTDIMYQIQDVHSFWNWAYFVILIVIGAFFLINLCLVVIATQFSETKQRESKLMEEQRKRFRSSSTLASNGEVGSCYDEILKYIGHLFRHVSRRFRRWRKRMHSKRKSKVMPAISLRRKKKRTRSVHLHHHLHHHHHYHFGNVNSQAPRASPEDSDVSSSPSRKHKLAIPSSNGSAASLQSMNYCTEKISKLEPSPLCQAPLSSPYHMTTTLSIHRASSINYPTTNSKDLNQAVAFAKMASDKEGSTPTTPSNVSPGRLQEKWTELCGGNHMSRYSKLPPIKTDTGKDSLAPSHPPLAQRLSAPPLTQPGSPNSHLTPPSPCLAMHSSCPVHSPCPVHTPCPTHSPCFSSKNPHSNSHSCSHVCTSEHRSEEYAWSDSSTSSTTDDSDSDSDTESKAEMQRYKVQRRRYRYGYLSVLTEKVQEIVESKYFMRGILVCILINTLSMGIEFHGQPYELTEAIEISNLIFTSLFALEMILKIIAYGPVGYVSNGFNVFDGLIVIVSVVEVLQDGSGGLSVLRTFRLLRILKLVRFMPALRRQLLVMLRTMDNVATFFSLLALFIFIFSILGMHIFGCKFCDYIDGEQICDRKNFDSLLWAIVTVFQILTQEDWNVVLYNGMSRTSPWAALYFIALMTFGNYVLFNLLVAILVEGFSAEPEQKEANLGDKPGSEDEEEENEENEKEEKNLDEIKDDVLSVASDKDNSGKLAITGPPPEGGSHPLSPPIITHTAATPQGSPNVDMQRAFRGSFIDHDTRSWDSDSQSLSSLNIRGSPRLPRSPSANSVNSHKGGSLRSNSPQDQKPGGNFLTPYQLGDELGQDNDSHSSVSISRSSLHDGSHNGYLPDSDNNDSRRTSYISCNGGSVTAIPQADTQVPVDGLEDNKDLQTEGTQPTTYSNIEDPDAIDEAKKRKNSSKSNNRNATGEEKDDGDVDYDDDGDDDFTRDCCCIRCCPEPKGCFKTREEYSLYLLSPRNKTRRKLQHLIAQKWFDYAILLIIFLNCITLAMERPAIEPDSVERKFLTISNYIFMAIFSLEMLVKVLAKGFLFGTHAYLHSGWNVMDGSLVIVSWIDLLITVVSSSSPEIFSILRVFRLLRTLRPLRVISRAPGLKLVVQTLLSSLRPIGNIVIICCTFFIIFGILGIQLFKGQFYYCSGPNVRNIKNRTQCEANSENEWINQQYNFDNLAQALVALFVLASKDGWVDIMYNGIDAVGVDQQPQRDHNEWLILYFISFLLIVGFFVLNMFVGVVVENFHKCREEQAAEELNQRIEKRQLKLQKARQSKAAAAAGVTIYVDPSELANMTPEERANCQIGSLEQPYYINYSKTRMSVHNIVMSKYFDLVVAAIIFLNVITMALEFYMMPQVMIDVMTYLNYIFTAVFILEALLKIFALGIKRYFKDGWNQLDITIVLLSIAGIVLEELESNIIPINPTIIRIMRVLRIARVLKLLKMAQGIRALLDTVFQALPQVGNLGLLFFLLFFIFAALGVELFGRLACTDQNPCEGLGRHASFKHFFIAFLTLFRIATGDNWNGIMKDTLRKEGCDDRSGCEFNCCANRYFAPMYFFSFVLIAQFVLVNVVVAVLMKHLEESHKLEQDDEEDAQIIADQLKQDAIDAAALSEREDAANNSDEGSIFHISSSPHLTQSVLLAQPSWPNQEQGNVFTPLLKVTSSNPEMSLSRGDKKSEKDLSPADVILALSPHRHKLTSDNPSTHLVVKQPVSRVKSLPDNFQFAPDKQNQTLPNDANDEDEEKTDGDQILPVPQLYLKPKEQRIAGQQSSSADSISAPEAPKDTSSLGLSKSSLSASGGGGLGCGLMVPGRDNEREGSPNPQRKFAARQLNPVDNTLGGDLGASGYDAVPAGGVGSGEEVPLQEWRVPPVVISSTSSEDDSQRKGAKALPESPAKKGVRNRTSPGRKNSAKKPNHTGSKGNNGNENKNRSDSLLSVESGCSSDNDSLLSSPQIRQRKSRRKNTPASNSSSCSNSPKSGRSLGASNEESGLRTPSPLIGKGHSNPLLWEPNGQTNNSPRLGNGTQNGRSTPPAIHVDSTQDKSKSNHDHRV
ncbi:voltage-dependent T-type calcium channel subunit alpha-1I-like isoform X5 [Lytechinus variegatus]|uniref:voltage-dependent T-type calcium channel subunit alpha-1I-like isoform X5 n=1 Tax=Lytechinus variegatus TaxID=7654 RepID=UPI001BB25297|nr:voltage-dependent T-type calcium channel subunit alpha-1I-like isoform X5 [Lytechinus variegatus]